LVDVACFLPGRAKDLSTTRYSRTPLIRTLVIRTANYPNRLGPSGKLSRILQN